MTRPAPINVISDLCIRNPRKTWEQLAKMVSLPTWEKEAAEQQAGKEQRGTDH
jgi:hypothetical protein